MHQLPMDCIYNEPVMWSFDVSFVDFLPSQAVKQTVQLPMNLSDVTQLL